MKKINLSLGKVICALRHSAGMSQEELADKAAVHRTYISQIERGLKSPTIVVLFKVSKALETSPSKILRLLEHQLDAI